MLTNLTIRQQFSQTNVVGKGMQLFISYRRRDTGNFVPHLYDSLADEFGEESIFFDVDNAPLGRDFRLEIIQSVMNSHIVLAVIGPNWMNARWFGMTKGLGDQDFVRLELETALKYRRHVFPILVGDNTPMPSSRQLPESLKDLSFTNALRFTENSFKNSVSKLIEYINSDAPIVLKCPNCKDETETLTKNVIPFMECQNCSLEFNTGVNGWGEFFSSEFSQIEFRCEHCDCEFLLYSPDADTLIHCPMCAESLGYYCVCPYCDSSEWLTEFGEHNCESCEREFTIQDPNAKPKLTSLWNRLLRISGRSS